MEIRCALPIRLLLASLRAVAKNCHGSSLELFVDTPRYKSRRFDDIPYLDASAAYKDGALVLNVVNRHPDQPIETDIDLAANQKSTIKTELVKGGPAEGTSLPQ